MVRDGITYMKRPPEANPARATIETCQTGATKKNRALNLLEIIHHKAQGLSARIVWLGDLTFDNDGTAHTTAEYLR